jgi:lipopolysaccharide/colanic/teichoic acid biosynthesis glycosyltransferase
MKLAFTTFCTRSSDGCRMMVVRATTADQAEHTQVQVSRGFYARHGKRGLDLVLAVPLLVAISPLLLAVALAVRLGLGAPVLFRQERVGRDERVFRLLKFRTMTDARDASGRLLPDAERLTGLGLFLRRWSLDELPQLWNVVRGDMSLVGPRPERPEIIEELRGDLPGIERRLAAAPGLTGLAQVRNGYSNDVAGMRRKLAYDLRYLRSRSLVSDMKLILETIPRVWDPTAC